MTVFDCRLPHGRIFTPDVVDTMLDALAEAWQILTSKGVRPDAIAAPAVREILAKGIVQTAELGERDLRRLRDAALKYYLRRSLFSLRARGGEQPL
jgi:hypothetical protein